MHSVAKSTVGTIALSVVTIVSVGSAASAQAPGDAAYFRLERYRMTASNGELLGYRGAVRHDQGPFPSGSVSAVRPNGEQTWGMVTPTQLSSFSGMSSTLSEVDAWSEQNMRGTWQFGTNGTMDKSYDTTAQWDWAHQYLSNDFVELAAPSIALFDTIRTQGLTGTFTFNLTQSVAQWNINNWFQDFFGLISSGSGMSAPIEILEINGSSFDVTITNALAVNSQLRLTNAIRYENPGHSQSRYVSMASTAIYGMPNPVPAPSAIALLGLAGFAERRRRRG